MAPASTRTHLLETAARVILERGFATSSMEFVRQHAGVSNGSLYHHFPSKACLADALYAYTLRNFHSALLARIAGGVSAEAGVKGLVRAYVQWVVRHPERARLLHELRRNASLTDGGEWTAANADAFSALAQWVNKRVAAGDMQAMAFPVWMALVFAPAMALTPGWVAHAKPAVSPQLRATLALAAWKAVAVPEREFTR